MRVSDGSGRGPGRQLGVSGGGAATVPPCGRKGHCRSCSGERLGPPPHSGGNTGAPVSVDKRVKREGQHPRGFSAHLYLLSRPERAAQGPHLQRQWPCQDRTPGTCPVARAQDSAGVLAWGLPALTAGEQGQPGATPARSPSPPLPLSPFLPRAPPRGPPAPRSWAQPEEHTRGWASSQIQARTSACPPSVAWPAAQRALGPGGRLPGSTSLG